MERTAAGGENARLYLVLAAFWAAAAAITHQAWLLAMPACGLAALACLPGMWLDRASVELVGPPPVPPLPAATPAGKLALLRELRQREQRHHDRAWLLAGTVTVLGTLDLCTGVSAGSPAPYYLLAPLALVFLLLGRTRLIAIAGGFVDRLGETIATEAGEGPLVPLRSWPPPGAVVLLVLAAALAIRVPL